MRAPSAVLVLMLYPTALHAQDASGVAVLLLPPVFFSPLLAALARSALMRRLMTTPPPLLRNLAVAWLELILWLAFAFIAVNTYYAERWHLQGVVAFASIFAISWFLNRRLLGAAEVPSGAAVLISVLALPLSFVVLGIGTLIVPALLEIVL